MKEIKPGMVVEYVQQFRGVVAHVSLSGDWLTVRNSSGYEYVIQREKVVNVLNPEPSEGEVIEHTACPKCFVQPNQPCADMRGGRGGYDVKHPHRERIARYIADTGWTP